MNRIKKLLPFTLMLLLSGFFLVGTMNSCRDQKKKEEATEEHAEHPEGEEHPEGSEHPEGEEHPEGSEHPEGEEHPTEGEHPEGEEHPKDSVQG